jgi:hypothetical protein
MPSSPAMMGTSAGTQMFLMISVLEARCCRAQEDHVALRGAVCATVRGRESEKV